MFVFMLTIFLATFTARTRSLERRVPSRIAVTNYVLPLVVAPQPYPVTPSSRFLHKRRSITANLSVLHIPHNNTRSKPAASTNNGLADVQQDLSTLGGRVYMTEITLARKKYTVVIDTGSSDTWIASSSFQCVNPLTLAIHPQSTCNFGPLFEVAQSPTWRPIPQHEFSTGYISGEFLVGDMGTEEMSLGGKDGMDLAFRQTIGVVKRGWWLGDGVSSGLMGLAYPVMASNWLGLNYTSVIFSMFENGTVPPIFSLALMRPTTHDSTYGGLLAIGGIPDIPHEKEWTSVPILRTTIDPESSYSFYTIKIDGFDIIPPPPSESTSRTSAFTNRPNFRPFIPPPDFSTTPLTAILDSGSSLLSLPLPLTVHIASLFLPPATYNPSHDWYTVPCDATPPRVGVIIRGKRFWIHPDDLMNKAPGNVKDGSGKRCVVAVQSLQGRMHSVLGDSWLRSVVVVFDLGGGLVRITRRAVP